MSRPVAPHDAGDLGGRDLIALVADEGTFEPWDVDVMSDDPLGFSDSSPYRERLADGAGRIGLSESVLTGRAEIQGHALALIAGEFSFLAGSMGVATGERLARAFERAEADGLPVLAMPRSGGARIQEGSLALMQMARTAASVRRFREAGLCYIVYLVHPVMGGVFASWGSLGHVTFAMPGAMVGFTGPRVVQLTEDAPLPPGTQMAETLLVRGLIDDLVAPDELRERMATILAVIAKPRWPRRRRSSAQRAALSSGDAWASVCRSRESDRPTARDLLAECAEELTILHGDGCGGGDDPGCLAALARISEIPAVIVAHDRRPNQPSRMGPAGHRKARRAMSLAHELRLPLITVIDTPGAENSKEAEEGGLSAEIARSLADMSAIRSPTLCVLLGEGAGGSAVALLPADRVICAEHSWLSPISPEGASAILFRTIERAPDLAASLGLASWVLLRFKIVDVVVPETTDPNLLVSRLASVIEDELRGLLGEDERERLSSRAARYREVGGR
jgi:acetyl-CoA carboxylase carboxyl transferase beta subunit